MNLTDRINAIHFDSLTNDEFDFLVERALKSVRKSTKPAVRKPSKAHEALVAMIPQVDGILGEKGQIVIPAKARKLFKIKSGDHLIVLGDEGQGLAIIRAKDFLKLADAVKKMK